MARWWKVCAASPVWFAGATSLLAQIFNFGGDGVDDVDNVYINGSGPLVRANRVHDNQRHGILVSRGACPRIEENEIWGNTESGLLIGGSGSDPLVRANPVDGA